MKLSDQIDAMHQEMLAEYRKSLDQVSELDRALFEYDAKIMRAFEGILEGQAKRGTDIHRMMKKVWARIGHVPSDEHLPLYENGEPRPRIGSDPEADVSVKVVAARYAPPLRSESTSGDALGLYDSGSNNSPFGPN